MKASRCYIYKCVVDDGGAPCVDDGLLSLTICKPYIRSTARRGDWIFAFGSNNEAPQNRLVYIAEVSQRLSRGQYFERPEYEERSDCIYERLPDEQLGRRRGAKFHHYPGAETSDLGAGPDYRKANALISENFRYFGRNGTAGWKNDAPHLRKLVADLERGHRVNVTVELRDELTALRQQVWRKHPTRKILGTPLHAPTGKPDPDCGEIVKVCKTRCYYIPRHRSCEK